MTPRTKAGKELLEELAFRDNYIPPGVTLNAIAAIEEEAVSEYREALEPFVEYFHEWWSKNGYCLRCMKFLDDNPRNPHAADCDLTAAERLLQADQVAAAEPGR